MEPGIFSTVIADSTGNLKMHDQVGHDKGGVGLDKGGVGHAKKNANLTICVF